VPASGLPRASPGQFARRTGIILGLVWSAAPLTMLLMIVLAVSGGVTPTATAWLQRAVLNELVSRGTAAGHPAVAGWVPLGANMSHVIVLAVILGSVGMVGAVTQYGRAYVQAEMRRRISVFTQDRMAQAVNSFPGMSRFESPEFADKLRMVQQISNDTAPRMVSSGLQFGQSLITAVGMFATLEVINPALAVIVGGTAVPAIAAQLSNARKRAGLDWRKSPALRRQMFYSQLMSDRAAAKEVRLFGLGGFLRGRMLDEVRSVNREQRSLDLRILSVEGSLALLAAAIAAAGTVWIVRQALAAKLSVGDVSLFAMAVVGVQGAISGVVTQLAEVYRSLLMFGHYVDVVTAGPDLPLASRPRPVPALRYGVEVRDVWFRYDDAHPWALCGVSLFIPAGQSVALVGLNGAGKSTLVKLICRFYDPAQGAIFWDGTDIRDMAPQDLRARIGTVFQDYMNYDLTAAENIGMGDLDLLGDMSRIRAAAIQAGADDQLTRLPRGYDTLLSRIFFDIKDKDNPETGVFLSGGQWQRLAVARGLMRADRDLLILDEPSSGMDAEAEDALHRRLYAIRQGRTSLLISHRLGSIRDADMIYVLAAGRVAELGTHATLMKAGGEYCRLFTLQGSGYQDPGGHQNGAQAQHDEGAQRVLPTRSGACGDPGGRRRRPPDRPGGRP
jgi:ATP-binding cassette, subfamily B, bacterial